MPEKKNEPEKIDGGRKKIVHSPCNIMNLCNVNNTTSTHFTYFFIYVLDI